METINIWIPLGLAFLAGISTGIGSVLSLLIKHFKRRYLCFALGLSAGVMIYVSFVELLPQSIAFLGFIKANIAFFIGILVIMLIDFLVPHEYIFEHVHRKKKHNKRKQCTENNCNRRLMRLGLFTALGIAIHNIPEGFVIATSSMENISLGIALAFAVAIHNIPEGIAIAIPIYYATKNRSKAFWYSFLSGLAEPIGALIALVILAPILNEHVLNIALAFTAGIMIYISFDELLQNSFKKGPGHYSVAGIFTGMAIMALSLYLL